MEYDPKIRKETGANLPARLALSIVNNERPGVFAGENPLIMLYRPGGDELVAVASLWHCTYSEQGAGNSLVIGFAYRKEIPLFSGVGLYIDYAASSRGQ